MIKPSGEVLVYIELPDWPSSQGYLEIQKPSSTVVTLIRKIPQRTIQLSRRLPLKFLRQFISNT